MMFKLLQAHRLEEEKSNLMYEISEMEMAGQDTKRELKNLQHMVEVLQEKLKVCLFIICLF